MQLGRAIRDLNATGMRPAAIARSLGVANSTVEYHLTRRRASTVEAQSIAPPPAAAHVNTSRARVISLLERGLPRAEIARRLGLSKATVSYHARRAGAAIDARCARRYDWAAVQAHYDRGHTLSECRARFGFTRQTWHAAVKRGAIVPRPTRLPDDEFFAAATFRSRTYLKKRLIRDGHRQPRCERCGLEEWQGRPLSIALHHLNGDRDDNRLENLQLLCPNCHSQTDSFSGRNRRRREEGWNRPARPFGWPGAPARLSPET